MAEETITQGDVYIFRGLPGVGKTKLANDLARQLASEKGAVILSSDDFFLSNEGKFVFDKDKVQESHKWNFKNFRKAIEEGLSPIFIDNTNIKHFHYYHYIDYAQRHGYRVVVIIIPHNDVSDKELEARTTHGANRDTIRKMRKNFDWEIKP